MIIVIYCFYKVYQVGTVNMAIYRLYNKNKIMYKNTVCFVSDKDEQGNLRIRYKLLKARSLCVLFTVVSSETKMCLAHNRCSEHLND